VINLNLDMLQIKDYQRNEAYKILRTNVQFCGDDKKVIAITSCQPEEGKSSVSFNLAVSLAESGKHVVFIDADLRKSVMMHRYRIHQSIKGLTHYLSGQNLCSEVIQEVNKENLHVIFSGPVPPNPAELLSGSYFKVLIKVLRENYDYVIIDTPPLGSVIDCAIVSQECDGVIMVIESNSISYKFARMIKEQINKSGAPLLGVVMNKVDLTKDNYRYYGYYGTYGSE